MPAPDDDATLYADDPAHPIPYLGQLDMMGAKRDGGATLMMLVHGPLGADERSQRRLLRKFDGYIGYLGSPGYASQFGAPDPATTEILVQIDGASDPAVFELLRRCEPWVREAKATLVVDAKPPRRT